MATAKWTNASSSPGDWNVAGNWSNGTVPSPGDDIVIPDSDSSGRHDGPYFVPAGFAANSLALGRCGLLSGGPIIVSALTWTKGQANVSIVLNGPGTVSSGGNNFGTDPYLTNNHTLTVNGSLTIAGPGDLSGAGGDGSPAEIVNNGTITLTASAGIFANTLTISGDGPLVIAGDCRITGAAFVMLLTGAIQLNHGARLTVSEDSTIHLQGGTLTGEGTLVIGNGTPAGGGYLSVDKPTSIAAGPTLHIAIGGTLQPPSGVAAAKAPALSIDGALQLSGGQIQSNVHIGPSGTCTVDGTTAYLTATLDNYGTYTVTPGSGQDMDGGVLRNYGRVVLSGTGGLGNLSQISTGGSLLNYGLLEKTGPGAGFIALDVEVTSTGNIAVRGGTLDLVHGTNLAVAGGAVWLAGGNIGSSDRLGSLTLSGGPLGGRLTGSGTVGAPVTNGGWVEPSGGPIKFTGSSYVQTEAGSIALPASALSGKPALVELPGATTLAGSLWIAG